MKKLIGILVIAVLSIAGVQILLKHQNKPLLSPTEKQSLRDAPTNDLEDTYKNAQSEAGKMAIKMKEKGEVQGPSEKHSPSRKCVLERRSAKCGEAREIVKCEGYKKELYIADDQPLNSLKIDVWFGQKVVKGFFRIDHPKAGILDYSRVIARWGKEMLGGNFKPEAENIKKSESDAMQDLLMAFKNWKESVDVNRNIGDPEPEIGAFEIPIDAPLYHSCYKSEGVATPAKEDPPPGLSSEDKKQAELFVETFVSHNENLTEDAKQVFYYWIYSEQEKGPWLEPANVAEVKQDGRMVIVLMKNGEVYRASIFKISWLSW